MKKKLGILPFLIVLVSLTFAVNVGASSNTCGDNLTWELKNGTLTISGSGTMDNWSGPSSLPPWYSNRASIKSVVIESGVTSIGNCAFYNCSKLTKIKISNTVTSIGRYAFEGCSNLPSVSIPNKVDSIGQSAFYNCSSLSNVSLSSNLTALSDFIFHGCSSLKSITIPEGVTTIGRDAFGFCSDLVSINLPDGLIEIDSYAFEYCTSLKKITIPNSVKEINYGTFRNCTSLTNINLSTNLSYISSSFCYGCTKLKSIKIPKSVLYIASDAFENCKKLSSVTISNPIIFVYSYAFSNCTSLTDVYYKGLKEDWEVMSISSGNNALQSAVVHCNDGVFTSDISNCSVKLSSKKCAYNGSPQKPDVTVKKGSTSLTNGSDYKVVYSNNKNIGTATVTITGKGNYTGTLKTSFKIVAKKDTSLTVGDFKVKITNASINGNGKVSIIGLANAKLKEVKIPATMKIGGVKFNVTEISKKAFYGCSKLKKVTLGKNVTVIGDKAFYGCSKLEKIKITSTKLKTVGKKAFKGIKSNAKIVVPKSKLSKYEKLLSGKGQGSNVIITAK